ncbi:MAG: DUF1566 domain-containing protein [Elusimicrobiota bacterium]|nr:DUF1566 domain-containing protein [Elusimicrobiota bacterium]
MLRKAGKNISVLTGLIAALVGFSYAADISTHTFLNCNLPDTGQTASYTATPGEDHDYQPTGSRPGYTIYNPVGVSSVTVDNRTGLMWVTNPNDAGIGGIYTWENAITACETSGYAGYPDWRLPNIKELVSIVDYSTAASAKINGTYFLNTQANYYWSSTTYVPNTTYAWYVYFGNGSMDGSSKTGTYYVRCVRGGP